VMLARPAKSAMDGDTAGCRRRAVSLGLRSGDVRAKWCSPATVTAFSAGGDVQTIREMGARTGDFATRGPRRRHQSCSWSMNRLAVSGGRASRRGSKRCRQSGRVSPSHCCALGRHGSRRVSLSDPASRSDCRRCGELCCGRADQSLRGKGALLLGDRIPSTEATDSASSTASFPPKTPSRRP